jgi:hypothetical protein
MLNGQDRIPDRIYIDEEDRVLIKTIDDHPEADVRQLLSNNAPANRNRKEQFLYFMAVGVAHNTQLPIKKRESGGFFLLKDLKPEDNTLIDTVAIWDQGNADVLSDRAKVLEIAERYAHAGVRFIADNIDSQQFGSFLKKMEQDLWKIFENVNQETNANKSEK